MWVASSASQGFDAVRIARLDPPQPPAWVDAVLGPEVKEQPAISREGLVVRLDEARDASFLRVSVPAADALDDPAFAAAVERAYATIGAILRARGERPLRFWNYIPAIRRRRPGGASRYEVFNEGRFAGYASWSEVGHGRHAPASRPGQSASNVLADHAKYPPSIAPG